MPDLKAQLEIAADASGVEAGVSKAKKSLSSLGVTAESAGKRAADGIDKIGEGGDKAATKVDRSTKSLIGSIQRTTAALEAGGRSSSDYFKALASQRGVDTGALKPYLDQLDAVQAKQKLATAALSASAPALGQVGISSKQAAAALRGVPAQFTDIVVALQAGQNPLTVFLQQGGQLKDMFGGLGPAARALGGYVVGLINPFTLAAAAVAALGLAYFQGSKEADEFAKAIILSGNAAGLTVGQLTAMAQRIDAITGTQGAASAALAEFAANGKIASSNIERFTILALRLEKEGGQAVKETVKQFAELGKSPVDAAIKLNETTNFLTTSVYRQIRALEEQGRTADAAALAQKSYADALDGRLGQVEGRLGLIERGWRAVVGAAKEAWDAMLNVGRADTLQDQLASVQKDLENRLARGPLNDRTAGSFEKGNEGLRQRISFLQEMIKVENRSAESAKAAADQVQARIRFDKEGEQFATNAAKIEREVAKARAEGAAAGATQAEIEKRIADIRAKYTTKTKSPQLQIDKAQLNLDVEAIRNASEQLIGLYVNSERILESVRSAGLLGDKEYYEAKRAFIRLESEAKEEALLKEIERFQQEKLSGKDRLDNERKIAEANSKLILLRADASARLTILANQEEAAANRIRVALLSARQAAQDYFDTIERQQDRSLEGAGQGRQRREFNNGINQIEDRYASQRRDLENQRAQAELEGKFTEDARKQYEARLDLIREFQEKSIDSYTRYYEQLIKQQSDFGTGAREAFQNYVDELNNVAGDTEELFNKTFRKMEDALVEFAKTGKLNFKDFIDSIIADIVRFTTRQLILKPIFNAIEQSSQGGAGGGLGVLIGQLLSGGRATGGPVSAGGMYRVNEKRPEMLEVGGQQFLMMGSQPGKVTPTSGGADRSLNVTNHFTIGGNVDRRTQRQIAAEVGRSVQFELSRGTA